jgi:uncharacterized protein YciI
MVPELPTCYNCHGFTAIIPAQIPNPEFCNAIRRGDECMILQPITRGEYDMPKDELQQYIYVFDPVRPELVTDPNAWTENDIQIAERHFAYLKQATEEGIVILAGRSQDGLGPAVVIFEADSEEAARRFMESDPFVSGGLMRANLHPFRAALVRS